jgi:hypothetical protein
MKQTDSPTSATTRSPESSYSASVHARQVRFLNKTVREYQREAIGCRRELTARTEALIRLLRAAEYVCVHRFGNDAPIGTRLIAIDDLKVATNNVWKSISIRWDRKTGKRKTPKR